MGVALKLSIHRLRPPGLLDLDLVLLIPRQQLLLWLRFGNPIQDANRCLQEVRNIQPLQRRHCCVDQLLVHVEYCDECICSEEQVVSSLGRTESIYLVCTWFQRSVGPMCEVRL